MYVMLVVQALVFLFFFFFFLGGGAGGCWTIFGRKEEWAALGAEQACFIAV